MKTKYNKSEPHRDINPRKLYLMGWVVGYEYSDGGEQLDVKCVIKDRWDGKPYRDYDPIMRSEKASERVAKEYASKNPNGKWFYREYIYETDNPKHAKGMSLMKDSHKKKIYVN